MTKQVSSSSKTPPKNSYSLSSKSFIIKYLMSCLGGAGRLSSGPVRSLNFLNIPAQSSVTPVAGSQETNSYVSQTITGAQKT